MANSEVILAKPSGITLEVHTSNVVSEAESICKIRIAAIEKYRKFVGKSLCERLKVACELHDQGKAAPKWQKACQADYTEFARWEKANPGKTFTDYKLSAGDKVGENLRKANFRHELAFVSKYHKKYPLAIAAAIAAHHSKLNRNQEHRWKIPDWQAMERCSNYVCENADVDVLKSVDCFINALNLLPLEESSDVLKKISKSHYEVSAVRSLLQLSDRRASAKEENSFTPELKAFKYAFPYPEKRGVQELVNEHWKDDILLVRAPTGAGKTDAALLWAKKQIDSNRADRLVFALPTRFTSTALSISITESLSQTGLFHSSAWNSGFEDSVRNGQIAREEAKAIHEYARLLESSTTVCTIDHLLASMTLSREDQHHIFFNLANSCLVLDEADFYDDFIQANIFKLLKVLKELEVPVLLMSASLPEITLEQYQQLGFNVNEIYEDNSDSERDRFKVESISEFTEVQDLEDKLEICVDAGRAIIYANTVDSAKNYYEFFKNKGLNVILYHSRFTEPDKRDKEAALLHHLGKDSNPQSQCIAIMTQIGEMSINISTDVMLSELCPIDRLMQRAGRLCRFSKDKIGKLHITIPMKDDVLYPAPYGSYNKKQHTWEASEYLSKTMENLDLKLYNHYQMIEILNTVYSENKDVSVKACDNANNLEQKYKCNWLINPAATMDKDDHSSLYWTSRDIPEQETVYIEAPLQYSFSYSEFYSWSSDKSLELPVYLIQKLVRNNLCTQREVKVRGEKQILFVLNEGIYDSEIGISMPIQSNFI